MIRFHALDDKNKRFVVDEPKEISEISSHLVKNGDTVEVLNQGTMFLHKMGMWIQIKEKKR